MSFRHSVLVVLLLLTPVGCTTVSRSVQHHAPDLQLEDRFAPLESVVELPSYVMPEATITTIGVNAYVADLKGWQARHPINSPAFMASLLHEREHSVRQLKYGVVAWIAKYIVDSEFMWTEEQRGWYYEIRTLMSHGQINTDAVAAYLTSYKTIAGTRMVNFADAKKWVIDVIAGRWKPQE